MNGGKKQGIIEVKKSDGDLMEITKRKGHLIVVSW